MRKCLISAAMVCMFLLPVSVYGTEIIDGAAEIKDAWTKEVLLDVSVKTIRLPVDYPYRYSMMWGVEQTGEGVYGLPETIVQSMDVRVNDEDIYIPLSAYGDLGNAREVTVERTINGFNVIITGGEGDLSYRAVLKFDFVNILRRVIKRGEYPFADRQETVYSFIDYDSDL